MIDYQQTKYTKNEESQIVFSIITTKHLYAY
jgi:hypothetical protein